MQDEILRELIDRAAKKCGSKTKLAEVVGVTPQRINDWRSGIRDCPPEDVALIAYEAGMPAEEWLVRATLWKHREKPKGEKLEKILGKWSASTAGATVGSLLLGAGVLSQVLADVRQCILC